MEYNSKYYGQEIDNKLDLINIQQTLSEYIKDQILSYKYRANIQINGETIVAYHDYLYLDLWCQSPLANLHPQYSFECGEYIIVKDKLSNRYIGFLKSDKNEYITYADPEYLDGSFCSLMETVEFKVRDQLFTVPIGTKWDDFVGEGKQIKEGEK